MLSSPCVLTCLLSDHGQKGTASSLVSSLIKTAIHWIGLCPIVYQRNQWSRFPRHEWTWGSWGIAKISIFRSPRVVKGFFFFFSHGITFHGLQSPMCLNPVLKKGTGESKMSIPCCSWVQFSSQANKSSSAYCVSPTWLWAMWAKGRVPMQQESQEHRQAGEPRAKGQDSMFLWWEVSIFRFHALAVAMSLLATNSIPGVIDTGRHLPTSCVLYWEYIHTAFVRFPPPSISGNKFRMC